MEQKPIRTATGPEAEPEHDPAVEIESAEMSEEDERVVMERLRELGYIE